MSLVNIRTLSSGVKLGLWNISESSEQLFCAYPSLHRLDDMLASYRSEARKLEKLATHVLLQEMTGDDTIIVKHNADGCPVVANFDISISHTKGRVAVILSPNDDALCAVNSSSQSSAEHSVAVDIEYISPRVTKIASRFIRPDEQAETLLQQLVIWCAKETMYKYFSALHLELFDIRLRPFSVAANSEGMVYAENLKTSALIRIFYIVDNEYVLTYISR